MWEYRLIEAKTTDEMLVELAAADGDGWEAVSVAAVDRADTTVKGGPKGFPNSKLSTIPITTKTSHLVTYVGLLRRSKA